MKRSVADGASVPVTQNDGMAKGVTFRCQLCRIEGDPRAGTPTEWTVHDGVDITEEEKQRLFDALDAITEDSEQEARNLILHRFQRLFAVKMQGPALFGSLKTEPTGMKRLNSELRRAMFEWLQAIRAFLDHTETRIKRRYGENSDEFKSSTKQPARCTTRSSHIASSTGYGTHSMLTSQRWASS